MTQVAHPGGSVRLRAGAPRYRLALAALAAWVITGTAAVAQSPQPSSPVSDAAPAASAEAPEPEAQRAQRSRSPRHGPHRLSTGGLDVTIQSMTRALDLDAAQQARLREILLEEHRQILQARSEHSGPGADRVGPVLAILDRTRDQIRAMLHEDQKIKYQASVPRDQLAPANADVEHWLSLTRSKDPMDDAAGAAR